MKTVTKALKIVDKLNLSPSEKMEAAELLLLFNKQNEHVIAGLKTGVKVIPIVTAGDISKYNSFFRKGR